MKKRLIFTVFDDIVGMFEFRPSHCIGQHTVAVCQLFFYAVQTDIVIVPLYVVGDVTADTVRCSLFGSCLLPLEGLTVLSVDVRTCLCFAVAE